MIAITISSLSLLVSFITVATVILNNRKTIRNQVRQEHTRLLIQIDNHFVNDPELWAIYDNDPIRESLSDDIKKKSKRKTIIYLILNVLEVVFDYYNNIIVKSKVDKLYWESWENLFNQYFEESTEVQGIVEYSISAKLYSTQFSGYLLDHLNKAKVKGSVASDSKITNSTAS